MTTNTSLRRRRLHGVGLSLLAHGFLLTIALCLWLRPAHETDSNTMRWEVDMFGQDQPPPPPSIPETPPPEPEVAMEPTMEPLAEPASPPPQAASMAGSFEAPGLAVPADSLPGHVDVPVSGLAGLSAAGSALGNGTGAGSSIPEFDSGLVPVVRIQPVYPLEARRKKIEGWVRIEMTVLENGSVSDVRIKESSPPGVFDQAALTAAAQAKFRPVTQNGKPVRRRAAQTLRFNLQN